MKIVPNSNHTDELGLTTEDERALESMGDLRASLGIPDGEHLTSELLQAALKKKGQAATTARLAMAVRNRDRKLATRPTTEFNPNHHPAGSSKGGQFASKSGGGGLTVFGVETYRTVNGQRVGRTRMVRAKDKDAAIAAVRPPGPVVAWEAPDQTGKSYPADQWLIPMNQKAAATVSDTPGSFAGSAPGSQLLGPRMSQVDQANAKATNARVARGFVQIVKGYKNEQGEPIAGRYHGRGLVAYTHQDDLLYRVEGEEGLKAGDSRLRGHKSLDSLMDALDAKDKVEATPAFQIWHMREQLFTHIVGRPASTFVGANINEPGVLEYSRHNGNLGAAERAIRGGAPIEATLLKNGFTPELAKKMVQWAQPMGTPAPAAPRPAVRRPLTSRQRANQTMDRAMADYGPDVDAVAARKRIKRRRGRG